MMKKIFSSILVGVALIGLSACATNGSSDTSVDSSFHNSGIDGLKGHSRFGHSGFGHSKFGYSKFGHKGGFRGRSRFGGHRSFGGFGHRGFGSRGRLGGFKSFRGSRGFGRKFH